MVKGFVGRHGEGKTYCMVHQVVAMRRRDPGLAVFSNLALELPGEGPVHQLRRWPEDFIEARHGVVVVDEINTYMPSRLWDRVPPQMLHMFQMLRKYEVSLLWTAQNIARVDKVVRELTHEVVEVSNFRRFGFFSLRSVLCNRDQWDRPGRWGGVVLTDPATDRAYDTMEVLEVPSYTAKVGRGQG